MGRSQLRTRIPLLAAMVLVLVAGLVAPVAAHPDKGNAHHNPFPLHATETMRAFAADQQSQFSGGASFDKPCVNGSAAGFPCSNVDLLAHLPLADIGATNSGSKANDIWGWTDPTNGREYAIIGHVFGTSFIDITVPTAPVYLGRLPTHGNFGSSWRDIKVYRDHAFIVSEASGHGMQVFDLRQLRGRTAPAVTFAETAHYGNVSSSHNIAINEDSGYAYIVGAASKNSCSGGLHMVNINTPASPTFAGCYSADGYTHDTQCVVYAGPHVAHRGREICFNSNEDTLTIVDVTNKSNPVQLARTPYPGSAYTHQGWLTDDHRYFLLDDELDERNFGHKTRTRVFNVSNLGAPAVTGYFDSTASAIDHNQYVKGTRVYQANYRAGLRILDITNVATASLQEVGYFDVYPADNAAQFNGAWSTYPYYPSGNVVISGIEQGLFVVRPAGAGGTPPSPPEPKPTMHLGGLSGATTAAKGGKWNATITVTVHTSSHAPLGGITVSGSWSAGATGTGSCTTSSSGQCSITKQNIHKNTASVRLTVNALSHTAYDYDPTANDTANFVTLNRP